MKSYTMLFTLTQPLIWEPFRLKAWMQHNYTDPSHMRGRWIQNHNLMSRQRNILDMMMMINLMSHCFLMSFQNTNLTKNFDWLNPYYMLVGNVKDSSKPFKATKFRFHNVRDVSRMKCMKWHELVALRKLFLEYPKCL